MLFPTQLVVILDEQWKIQLVGWETRAEKAHSWVCSISNCPLLKKEERLSQKKTVLKIKDKEHELLQQTMLSQTVVTFYLLLDWLQKDDIRLLCVSMFVYSPPLPCDIIIEDSALYVCEIFLIPAILFSRFFLLLLFLSPTTLLLFQLFHFFSLLPYLFHHLFTIFRPLYLLLSCFRFLFHLSSSSFSFFLLRFLRFSNLPEAPYQFWDEGS